MAKSLSFATLSQMHMCQENDIDYRRICILAGTDGNKEYDLSHIGNIIFSEPDANSQKHAKALEQLAIVIDDNARLAWGAYTTKTPSMIAKDRTLPQANNVWEKIVQLLDNSFLETRRFFDQIDRQRDKIVDRIKLNRLKVRVLAGDEDAIIEAMGIAKRYGESEASNFHPFYKDAWKNSFVTRAYPSFFGEETCGNEKLERRWPLLYITSWHPKIREAFDEGFRAKTGGDLLPYFKHPSEPSSPFYVDPVISMIQTEIDIYEGRILEHQAVVDELEHRELLDRGAMHYARNYCNWPQFNRFADEIENELRQNDGRQ
jgi:hypothetical protein